ncbi:MAG TPA: hypothetical protein ENJ51_11835, partial [Leucothrix mucor]|nr:hypothetical protein [Leucothrix mucor]
MVGYVNFTDLQRYYFPEEKLPEPERDLALGADDLLLLDDELLDLDRAEVAAFADLLGGVFAPGLVPVEL